MGRTVFVNGEYVNEIDAKVSIFDRAFLFGDSVYEVTAVIEKKLVSWEGVDTVGLEGRINRVFFV